MLVADRRGLAGSDDLACQGVALAQIRHPVTAQDRGNCPSRQPEFGPDPVLAAAFLKPQLQHALLHRDRSPSRAPARSRRSICQAGPALGSEPGNPPVRALTGDTDLLSNVSNRSAVADYPINKQTTTMQIQTSVSVGHEDLLGQWMT